jgi:hypothetical protein
MEFTEREKIIETVNRLFIFTDNRQWAALVDEVFAQKVDFDMTSLGGVHTEKTSEEICNEWEAGFGGLDAVNHLAGNYLVDIRGSEASVFAYATATHYKEATTKGTTREFVGTYDLHLKKGPEGWRIDRFAYTLKYTSGNMDLS